jgi:hypothetical protein
VRQLVIERLNGERPAAGVRRAFYENARWLVLSLLFLREHLEQGATLTLTDAERAKASEQALEIANAIWAAAQEAGFVSAAEPYTAPRHFKSVFCTAEDCRKLKAGALKKLNDKATKPTAAGATEGAKT